MASWAATKCPPTRGARFCRSTLLTGAVILAAVSFAGNPAEAATAPSPEPGQVVTATSSANQQNKLFYQRRDHSLVVVNGTGATWGAPAGLGGKLTSGPGAIVIGSEFAVTSVFARGANSAIWYRQYSDGRGTWTPWATLGGGTTGAPARAASNLEPLPRWRCGSVGLTGRCGGAGTPKMFRERPGAPGRGWAAGCCRTRPERSLQPALARSVRVSLPLEPTPRSGSGTPPPGDGWEADRQ